MSICLGFYLYQDIFVSFEMEKNDDTKILYWVVGGLALLVYGTMFCIISGDSRTRANMLEKKVK